MSKLGAIIIIILSLVAGFGGGVVSRFIFNQTDSTVTEKTATLNQTVSNPTTSTTDSTKEQTLEECLTEVWGADKYAAISANSSLATTEDNLAALKCYNC